jgi:hypothetical protein
VLYASLTERPKTPVQRQADAGLMWEVIASVHDDPVIRSIAKALRGQG